MPKYTVKSPLNHDGKEYGVGETIELAEEQAAPLLAVNAISERTVPGLVGGLVEQPGGTAVPAVNRRDACSTEIGTVPVPLESGLSPESKGKKGKK